MVDELKAVTDILETMSPEEMEEASRVDTMTTVEQDVADGERERTEESEDNNNDFDIVSYCMNEMQRCIGENDTDEADQNRIEANNYYFGRLPAAEKCAEGEKRSDIVSMDVQDSIESSMAEIMPAFDDDDLGMFQPDGPDDEEQVRIESKIVNHTIFEECDGWMAFYNAIKDTMMYRNGILKVWWDVRYVVSYEVIEGLDEFSMAQAIQPTQEGEKVDVLEHSVDKEAQFREIQDVNTGEVYKEQISPAILSVKIRRTRVVSKPRIESVPPEELLVISDHPSPMLHNCRFVVHEKVETQSSLIEQGIPKKIVKNLPTYNGDDDGGNEVKYTRRQNEEIIVQDSADQSSRLIKVFECYPTVDADGDGIAERLKVLISNKELLLSEEIDYMPMISGAGVVVPHRWQGVSVVDRQLDIQKAKTHLSRSIINGTMLAANQRIGAVGNRVNIKDLLASRTGGVVRITSPDALVPVPNPEIPQSAFSVMSMLDKARRERGGSAVDNPTETMAVGGDSAHGVERIMSAIEQGNALYAKVVAETIVKQTYLSVHLLLRKYQRQELPMKINGSWISATPTQWPERTKLKVIIGRSHGERLRMAGSIMGIIETQKGLMESGYRGNMVTENNLYNALIDATRLNGLHTPERYFTSPNDPNYQANQQQQSEQAAALKQAQDQKDQAMVDAQTAIASAEQTKAAASAYKEQNKVRIDELKIELEAMVKSAEKAEKDSSITLDWARLFNDIATKVTELELEANKQLNEQYKDNLALASGGMNGQP